MGTHNLCAQNGGESSIGNLRITKHFENPSHLMHIKTTLKMGQVYLEREPKGETGSKNIEVTWGSKCLTNDGRNIAADV